MQSWSLSTPSIFSSPVLDYPQAADIFGAVRETDPYCITNMNTYSDVLFVMVSIVGLATGILSIVERVSSLQVDHTNTLSFVGGFSSLKATFTKL